ncbi:hypothetical protein ABKV19_027363 [Rosa sericea]
MVNRNSSCSSSPLRIQILLVLSLLFSPAVLAKSRRPISDIETRQKKTQCYADIDSGLWGWQCKSTMIAKENCVLKCLSPTCYELVYESDPLEEGEKDLLRGQEFKYCMHKYSCWLAGYPWARALRVLRAPLIIKTEFTVLLIRYMKL